MYSRARRAARQSGRLHTPSSLSANRATGPQWPRIDRHMGAHMTGLAGTRSLDSASLHPQTPLPGRPPGCVVALQVTRLDLLMLRTAPQASPLCSPSYRPTYQPTHLKICCVCVCPTTSFIRQHSPLFKVCCVDCQAGDLLAWSPVPRTLGATAWFINGVIISTSVASGAVDMPCCRGCRRAVED